MQKQITLKESFVLKGKGLHTGQYITAVFNPAPEGHGYKIQRVDIEGQPVIDCLAENVADTQRGTVLVKDDIRISTIEHAMAALYSAGVDNCLIQLDGPEMPILDGSAILFCEQINKVGLVEQNANKDFYVVKRKMEIKGENGEHIILVPDNEFCVNTMIAFNSKVLASQFATLDSLKDFETEIASARTFVFVREIEPLLQAGLIKGGDLDNAIVIYETSFLRIVTIVLLTRSVFLIRMQLSLDILTTSLLHGLTRQLVISCLISLATLLSSESLSRAA